MIRQIIFTFLIIFIVHAEAETKAPEFICFMGSLDACHKCEVDARGQNTTPKQISELYNKINSAGLSAASDDAKKLLDQALREKIFRLKLEAVYDVAVNGLYNWPSLNNWPEISERLLLNDKCFPKKNIPGKPEITELYQASKAAAEKMIKHKTDAVRAAEREEIVLSRVKTVFETRKLLNKLAQLRTRVARDELNPFFKDKSKELLNEEQEKKIILEGQIEKNKKEIKKLETQFIKENFLLKAPEIFRTLSVSDLALNSMKSNRSVGSFAPNDFYEKIEKLFNKQFTELEYPASLSELEFSGPTIKADINDYESPSDETLKKFIDKNKSELEQTLRAQYAESFMQLHHDIKNLCTSGVTDYYKHKELVADAAEELIKSKQLNRDQVLGGYKRMCEVKHAKEDREGNFEIIESSINNSKAAKAAGLIGVLIPVGGFIYAKVAQTAVGGIFLASTVARAQSFAQIGRAIKLGGEGMGVIYTGAVVSTATSGYIANTHDLEMKNLMLMMQMSKRADASEIEKLKGDIANLVVKTGESQTKLSDTGVKGLQGAFLAATTYFSLTQVLRELNDAQSLMSIRATLDAYRAGTLKQEEFLEKVYRIKTGNIKGPLARGDYEKWLETTKVAQSLKAAEAATLDKVTAQYALKVRDELAQVKNFSPTAVDDIGLSLLKFDLDGVKAAHNLLKATKGNVKELSELRTIITASAASPAKQRYLKEAERYIRESSINGKVVKLTAADKAVLKNWSDPDAINLILNIRMRATAIVAADKSLKGNYQKALDRALKEDLGATGFYNLCIKGGCPACVAK